MHDGSLSEKKNTFCCVKGIVKTNKLEAKTNKQKKPTFYFIVGDKELCPWKGTSF